MPFSPCCKRKYSKPCKCNSRCSNCECIVQTGQCPPPPSTTEDSDAPSVQLYTPVIAAAPASKKCCCCCDVKPKKSFWQQLFGDRKCCSPSQKKKQEYGSLYKQKKKQRCVPECTNPICCNDTRLSCPPASKPFRPLCCCKKVKACKCKSNSKPSCPTPGSIFGCRFYCNVENRPKQPRCSCCCCCAPKSDQKRSLGETTEVATDEEKIPTREVENKGSENKKKEEPKKSIDKPTHSNFRIGLTFTNTETKYYKKNSTCPPIEEECDYNNNDNEGSSDSSEQIITLEIHQSDGTVNHQDKNEESRRTQESNQRKDEETLSMSSSKRRKRLSLIEENEKYKHKSESYSRELLPLRERKSVEIKNMNENGSISTLPKKKEKRATINSMRLEENDLDKRVSEILRRLRTIENKINVIDLNKPEKTNLIESDSNDSSDDSTYKTKKNETYSRKPDAVIEIRKTRSKSYSPNRKNSSQISRYRYSRSLDRSSRTQRDKPKLVIKLPHGNKVNQGFVSTSSNKRVKQLSKDYQDSEWMKVSNELKNRKRTNTPCYCYECVCKRVSCRQ